MQPYRKMSCSFSVADYRKKSSDLIKAMLAIEADPAAKTYHYGEIRQRALEMLADPMIMAQIRSPIKFHDIIKFRYHESKHHE